MGIDYDNLRHATIPVAARSEAWSAAARLLGSWFESHRGHGCLSLVSVCCQVEVSATGRSLVQRSPTDCGVCLSVIK
jgi:uncharacterized membrane protein YccC